MDIIAGGTAADAINVFLGDGTGSFGAALSYRVVNTKDVAFGDVNNDGDLDIVTGHSGWGAAVLYGNGDGTFDTPLTYNVGVNIENIELADVNNDGTVDYEEFITLMCPSAASIVHKFRSQYKSIDDVRAAFKR